MAFSTLTALIPHIREPVWGFCQLLNISMPMLKKKISRSGWPIIDSGPGMSQKASMVTLKAPSSREQTMLKITPMP